MKVAVLREEGSSALAALGEEVAALLAQRGDEIVSEPVEDLQLVLNLTTVERARVNYIRPNPSVFVASLVHSEAGTSWESLEQLKRATYTALVKTMSNVVVHRVEDGPLGGSVYFMTPELGFRRRDDDEQVARSIVDYVTPLC
ncbi:MAG TPA: hypothetical protein ENK10_02630, partial [Acidobacteria bacterium]|nr:hypothetical protein [Acidobacteriota bacterium]